MIDIVGYSNGLLCVRIYNAFLSLPPLLLWNPAPREAREVPKPINNIYGYFEVAFGFSPSVNDYKIIMCDATKCLDDDDDHVQVYSLSAGSYDDNHVQVYSLSAGSWKEIKAGNLAGIEFYDHHPVTVNGAIFWCGCKPIEGEEDYGSMKISFDLVMEVFALISLPALLDFGPHDRLVVHENKLAILSLTVIGDDESCVIDLWVMEEGTGASGEKWGWSKIYSISNFFVMVPCCIWMDKIVFEVDNWPKYGEIALFLWNLHTLELENFATCTSGSCESIAPNYVESLVPIGNIHIEEP